MNYFQLLDPKAAARKESKKKASVQDANQASKDSAASKTIPVRLDPKALLNPKLAASKSRSEQFTEKILDSTNPIKPSASEEPYEEAGVGAMMERQWNIGSREYLPDRKRKSDQLRDDGGDSDSNKKPKSILSSIKSGGDVGKYLKSERDKGARESGPASDPIDLTQDDDDTNGDEDIMFLGESRVSDNREVCLGMVKATAGAWSIPHYPKHQVGKLGDGWWPQLRVQLHRTPGNNNAIQVMSKTPNSTAAFKFASMSLTMASVFVPLLDNNAVSGIRLKAMLDRFPRRPGQFSGGPLHKPVTLSITIYAPRNKAETISKRLQNKGFFLEMPQSVDPGVEYYNPQAIQPTRRVGIVGRKPQTSQISYVSRTQEEILRETSSMFDSLVKTEDLPEMEANEDLILTPLMAHQKQALHFLTQHEIIETDASEDTSKFSLWKPRMTKKGQTWYNIITNQEEEHRPESIRGGILADVMGLGKTLSILALIAETIDEAREFGNQEAPVDALDLKRNSKATLIICPKSVMSNWEEQIKTHTRAKHFKIYAYHGPNRTRDVNVLASHDIVLAPYQTAASEFSDSLNKRTALASTNWFRIVLDEAHQIRNPSTSVSKACCNLSAQRRWAVTGTPVQNRLDDLGALIKFLRIKPFEDSTNWAQHITAPFRNADPNVLPNLRLLVDSITLRRLKDKIDLVDRHSTLERISFTDEEMAIYSLFSKQSHIQLRLMLSKGNGLRGKSYAHVLKSITRLRSLCAHGREMLNDEDMKELEGLTAGTAIDLGDEPTGEPDDTFITEKNAYETFELMAETETNFCQLCTKQVLERQDDKASEEPEESDESEEEESAAARSESDKDTIGFLTPCFHMLCPGCISTFIKETKDKLTEDQYLNCPYCEQYVRWGFFELTQWGLKNMRDARAKKKIKGGKAKWDETTYSGPSSKVKALLEDLKQSEQETASLPPGEPPIRSVVFSGWTTYLDLIEYALDEHQIGYVRLDGTMSVKARSAVLKTFNTDDSITVLLVSIKAGGQGLNFTAANKVYMMEPQFNPGVETQAIDRVHRLGQKRDVRIVHYIIKDSIEEKILVLQEKKKKLAALSMERKLSKTDESKKRIEELRDLFK